MKGFLVVVLFTRGEGLGTGGSGYYTRGWYNVAMVEEDGGVG